MFINGGLDKFFHYMPITEDMPESMTNLMNNLSAVSWLMPLVGVVELVGGILFVIPKTRALGAIVVLPVMVGILCVNIFDAPTGLPIALILMAINIWVIYENRHKYMPMIKG
jgi:putative oxidoreductase